MYGQSRNDRVVQVQNLADYFRTSIDGVISRQGVDVDPHAAHYVVNLLTLFSRSEELYEDHGESYGLRPLALMMADAADARDLSAMAPDQLDRARELMLGRRDEEKTRLATMGVLPASDTPVTTEARATAP